MATVLGSIGIGTPALAQSGLEEVVVTGSRIARRDFTAASPVVTVGGESFENISTISVEQTLNQLPQFQPAGSQFASGGLQPGALGTPGIASLNLRGLGSNRNLVLVNGRRGQPANATLIIDTNSIPASAIQNVEVITGGASAVYGADAIGGVVNFILKDDFEGVEIDVQTSATEQGGGEESRFSALMGGNYGDSGNVMIGIEWATRNPVLRRDRDFFVEGWNDPGTLGSNNFIYDGGYESRGNAPSQAVVDQIFADTAPAGTASRTANFFFNEDGSLFQTGGALGYNGPLGPNALNKIHQPSGDLVGDDKHTWVSSPFERYSLFARAINDLTDNVSMFVQGNFSGMDVESTGSYSPAQGALWGAFVPRDAEHPVPPELEMLLDSRANPTAPWQLYRVLDYLGPRGTSTKTSVYQLMAGLEGSLPNNDWTWEAYVSQGRTNLLTVSYGNASLVRYRDMIAAPFYGLDYVNDAGRGFIAECASGLPVFNNFTPSDDCVDSLRTDMKATTEMEQKVAEFNIQGGIVDMPSGELRFAAGASYRENTMEFHPDLLQDNRQVIDRPLGAIQSDDAVGATDVAELYGELLVPVTNRLNLELGYRSSDYNTAGRVETYKTLFDFSATDRLRFRGGRQLANRAPNTAELFLGETLQIVGFPGADPCSTNTLNQWGNVPGNPDQAAVQALCSAIIANPTSLFDVDPGSYVNAPFLQLEVEIGQGNVNLDPEEAETYTLGAVWAGDKITASVDFYDVDIKDAIQPLDSFVTYMKCFNADGMSNPSYSLDDPGGFCRLIHRDDAGRRLNVDAPYFNLGGIRTAGADLQLNWRGDVGGNSMYVNTVLNYLSRYELQDTSSAPFLDSAGTLDEGGQFDWKLFTTIGYDLADFSLGVRWRHLPSADDASVVANPASATLGVDSYDMFDFFGRWSLNDMLGLRFGVDNLLDADPEIVGEIPGLTNARGSTMAGYYDTLGRRAYIAVKLSF
jgi:outer membrane receptor protein involved in Fe transport